MDLKFNALGSLSERIFRFGVDKDSRPKPKLATSSNANRNSSAPAAEILTQASSQKRLTDTRLLEAQSYNRALGHLSNIAEAADELISNLSAMPYGKRADEMRSELSKLQSSYGEIISNGVNLAPYYSMEEAVSNQISTVSQSLVPVLEALTSLSDYSLSIESSLNLIALSRDGYLTSYESYLMASLSADAAETSYLWVSNEYDSLQSSYHYWSGDADAASSSANDYASSAYYYWYAKEDASRGASLYSDFSYSVAQSLYELQSSISDLEYTMYSGSYSPEEMTSASLQRDTMLMNSEYLSSNLNEIDASILYYYNQSLAYNANMTDAETSAGYYYQQYEAANQLASSYSASMSDLEQVYVCLLYTSPSPRDS